MARASIFGKYRKELIFLSILGVTAAGVLLGSGVAYKVGAVASARYEKLELLAKVLYLVENNYVTDVKETDLIYGAIDGMLSTLDPHSGFLKPTTYKEMKVETQGKFSGIGIEITLKEREGLTVVTPIDDSPAFRAGLQAGDMIIAIDGQLTREMNLAEAVSKMRGNKGSKVKVTILRKGMKEPKDFVIQRDTIRIKSVKYRLLEPGYGYVRVTNFQESTAYDLNKALETMRGKDGDLRGLVLDLRNNPGGLLDQAIKVADTFLASGKIVITKGRNMKNLKVEEAHARGGEETCPMIVLVNGGSASASEIVAGALQDNGRAVVLGTRTFGKGTVQTIIEMDDGSGLKLTIARYFTPNNRDIQEKGIDPDIVMDAKGRSGKAARRTLREADLRGHLRNTETGKEEDAAGPKKDEDETTEEGWDAESATGDGENREDMQLRAALDYLKTWEIFRHHAVNTGKAPGAAAAAAAAAEKQPQTVPN